MNLRKIIREEMDDMWQNLFQGEGNIWLSHQMIVFDEVPTKEEVIKLIIDAFKSGFLKQESIDTWEDEGVENEANIIIRYELPYLRIDLKEGWLYYGSYGNEVSRNYPELIVIKYSEAKNYLVNESEEVENPLSWISEVPKPFQIETTPFKGESKKYWITKGEKIKAGDFVVYQTASGLWREYGIMNPEKVDNANEANSEYYKVLKVVNESEEDDFAWITDAPLNPWLEYDAIIFDKKPKKKKLNNYIELALITRKISNKEAWGIGRDLDIDGILEYIRQDGGAVLKIDQWGDLQYADISYYNSSHNSIRYSQLVNKNLNESEESGLGWMMKVNATPISMDDEWILVNDIDPSNIDEGIEIQKYLMNLGYDWFVKGEGPRQRKIYTIHHYPTKGLRGDLTYYSDREKGIANDTMEENKNAKIYYWSEVKPTYIKESEEDEWAWARNSFINSNEIKVGSKIRIHNLGDQKAFHRWLGDYRDGFLDGMYGEQIEGEVDYISGGVFSLVTEGDTIHFPTDEKMLDLNSREDYKNLHIGYELI